MGSTVCKSKIAGVLSCIVLTVLVACERDFDIAIKKNQSSLIVEGYINNEMPLYNYVVLSKSQDVYTPNIQNIPVSGAVVTITEGVLMPDNKYQWDETSTRELKEAHLPQLRNTSTPGFYFDPKLITDSANALRGKPGKHYLLQIETEGKQYSAITALLPPIPIDSLSSGFYYLDDIGDTVIEKARVTVHYKDPDTIGNTQLYFWRHGARRNNFGWGGLGSNEYTIGTDDLVNGQYIHLTQPYGFYKGDTVEYYMASVERKVYNFWDSYNKASSNNGLFSTPVSLRSTISGENVIGCFSGFSISTKSIIMK